MSGANSFGSRLVMTSFGESHGPAMGVVVDGAPAGISWDQELLDAELNRRRPGSSAVVSARAESDAPEILSGIYEGKTLGTPIAIMVRNHDARSIDYKELAPRTGHADDIWRTKFGHSDPRGGGRSSGRETVSRVIGGSIARMILGRDVRVTGFARQIGPYELDDVDTREFAERVAGKSEYPADIFTARYPSSRVNIEKLLLEAKTEGRSYGGVAEIWIDNAPIGLGQPVFRKIKADLAAAAMSLGATAGFEIGAGFKSTQAEGSVFHRTEKSSPYGGIRGGITTGERIVFRVGFKPTSSVLDIAKKGRHDPCIVPRALPVLEAMTNFVLADHMLWARGDQ